MPDKIAKDSVFFDNAKTEIPIDTKTKAPHVEMLTEVKLEAEKGSCWPKQDCQPDDPCEPDNPCTPDDNCVPAYFDSSSDYNDQSNHSGPSV